MPISADDFNKSGAELLYCAGVKYLVVKLLRDTKQGWTMLELAETLKVDHKKVVNILYPLKHRGLIVQKGSYFLLAEYADGKKKVKA